VTILGSKNLNHHGIVAAMCRELQVAEIIDALIPAGNRKKLSFGQLTEGMLINGLGFTTKPLYLTPMFFEDTDVEALFGKDITAEDFSDDSLGRCLDKMSEFGIEEIFSRIAYQACKNFAVDTRFQHLDTSVMQLEGEYDTATELIRFGRPKKGRSDLKQFLISMMVSNDGGVPLLADVISGNKSDQTHFREVLKRLGDSMKASDEDIYHIADAALYTTTNLKELASSPIRFITRVPSSLTEAEELFKKVPLEGMQDYDENYKIYPLCSLYGGVKQRWLLVFSRAAFKKELKTMHHSIRKERRELRKEISKLENRSFACEADAQKAIKLFKTQKYHKIKSSEVYEKEIKRSPGSTFKIQLKVCLSKEKALIEKKLRGKFIVASNELEDFTSETKTLAYEELLLYYKDQSKVEQGFRFLNDPLCMADAVYLKKESRIKALAMVMCLCLLVYSIAQRQLRSALKEQNESLPNQVGKDVQNPTLKWVFQLFGCVHVIYQELEGSIIKTVSNLNDLRIKILRLLGPPFFTIYGIA
jgi:transposase